MRYISHSAEETDALGQKLVKNFEKNTVICLDGEMGAGKTVFVQGCLKALGYTGRVTSPTFALCNEYFTENAHVMHYDLYRIKDEDDLYSVGFYDSDADLIFVEWAGNNCDMFDKCIKIRFTYGGNETERILESEDI